MRVPWGRTAADDVEHVVAMLLCREFPTAQRIRPSRGDGGIDIVVPAADGDGVEIYQVKSFAENLTAGQKRQVAHSLDTLVSYATKTGMKVRRWYLALPLDQTNENTTWLNTLAPGADFPLEWRGLAYLDGLAAKYPDVIDYYLRDGKDRLEQAVGSLSTLLAQDWTGNARQKTSDVALTPATAGEGLTALYDLLNSLDPHYRYEFSVTAEPLEVADKPRLVCSVRRGDEHRGVTFDVFERCAESQRERPVPFAVTITAAEGSGLAQDVDDFIKYGKPFVSGPTDVDGNFDLPGGIGGHFTGGRLSLLPAGAGAKTFLLRLQLLNERDEVLQQTMMEMQPASFGLERQGMHVSGSDQHGVFDLRLMTDLRTGRAKLSITQNDGSGRHPDLLLPGLRLLRGFHAPNKFRFAPRFGAAADTPMVIPMGEDHLHEQTADVCDLVEALAAIQQHTPVQIRLPQITSLTTADSQMYQRVAVLLNGGEQELPWEGVTVHLHPGIDPPTPGDLLTFLTYEAFSITVGHTEIPLNYLQVSVPAARVADEPPIPHEDHLDVRLGGDTGATAQIRYTATLPVPVPGHADDLDNV